MDYMTAKEAAQEWGISERRVQVLCEQGRVEGIARLGKSWAIPKDAKKPPDARRKSSTLIGKDVN
ncbi:helix-turn-helix domain-containing protein [Phascolarctobacterium sp.]